MQGIGGFLRIMLLMGAAYFLVQYFTGNGSGQVAKQPIAIEPQTAPTPRAPYRYCELETDRFHATLSSRGAALKHFALTTEKYRPRGQPIDLSTTPHPGIAIGDPEAENPAKAGEHEFRQQLFVRWRNPTTTTASDVPWNVEFDSVDYQLQQSDPSRCDFSYRDETVLLERTIAATSDPYTLNVTSKITNLAPTPRRHAVGVDTVAWRLNSEVQGSIFTVSPYITHVECKVPGADAVRLLPDAFEPGDFKEPAFAAAGAWGWYQVNGQPSFAAISNAYFSQALVPLKAPVPPSCQVQIENRPQGDLSHPDAGNYYRARLAYPEHVLQPGASETYEVLAYIGPKERQALAQASDAKHELTDLIDLGFFTSIAKVLVGFLLAVHGAIPNWGIAIILLTLTARVLLFPLMWPGIKNMVRMRELKPEMDALNEKFKDDPRAKGMAQMELYRKHNINLFMGCLPTLATMPVWFALYTTLQTAVELYNIPFLWFPDLSQPDPYFVLPFVIGATYFVQQKMMPMQGDPMQQKMMLYMMPAMFTVFMLFLPAGLGVYMFTNSVLGIVQQQAVEVHARKATNKIKGGKS